jgi:hypothetical protein
VISRPVIAAVINAEKAALALAIFVGSSAPELSSTKPTRPDNFQPTHPP